MKYGNLKLTSLVLSALMIAGGGSKDYDPACRETASGAV